MLKLQTQTDVGMEVDSIEEVSETEVVEDTPTMIGAKGDMVVVVVAEVEDMGTLVVEDMVTLVGEDMVTLVVEDMVTLGVGDMVIQVAGDMVIQVVTGMIEAVTTEEAIVIEAVEVVMAIGHIILSGLDIVFFLLFYLCIFSNNLYFIFPLIRPRTQLYRTENKILVENIPSAISWQVSDSSFFALVE